MGDSGMYYPGQFFPPVAKIDQYIAVLSDPWHRQYYKVMWLEDIPLYEFEFELKPGEEKTDIELTDLAVNDNELLHFRIALDGTIRVRASLPRAARRFVLRNNIAYIDPTIAQYPNFAPQTELAILEDNKLFVDIKNLSQDRYERAKIIVTGYRLVIAPVAGTPQQYAAVVIQGFGGIRR